MLFSTIILDHYFTFIDCALLGFWKYHRVRRVATKMKFHLLYFRHNSADYFLSTTITKNYLDLQFQTPLSDSSLFVAGRSFEGTILKAGSHLAKAKSFLFSFRHYLECHLRKYCCGPQKCLSGLM